MSCQFLDHSGFHWLFSFAPVFQWCCLTPYGPPGVTVLMGKETFIRTKLSKHCRSIGRGFGSSKTYLSPSPPVITDHSKAAFLLWFLNVTRCHVHVYMVFSIKPS